MALKKKSTSKLGHGNQGVNASQGEGEHFPGWIMVLLAGVLFIPPFFRGAFFTQAIHYTQMATLGTALLYLSHRTLQGQSVAVKGPFDWAGLWLIAAYLLPVVTFQWADLDQAVAMILWQISLFALYKLVRAAAVSPSKKGLIQDLFFLCGLLLALVGLLALAGYVSYTDAVMGNRIASTFQYPNTLAALAMTLFFIGSGRQLDNASPWRKMGYQCGNWLLLLVFILTYSRIAWLLFPIFAVLYWLLMPRVHKMPLFFNYVITAVTLFFTLQPLLQAAATATTEHPRPQVLLVALAGMLACAGLAALVNRVEQLAKGHEKLIYPGFVVAALAGIGLMVFLYNATEPLVFDGTLLEEPQSQSLTRTVSPLYPGDYTLELQVTAVGGTETEWPWMVDIYYLNQENQSPHLLRHTAAAHESGTISLDFQVPEEGEALRIVFRHHFPHTQATFHQASLLDESGEGVTHIPLRYTYLPEGLVSRFQSIDRAESSASTRLAYYRDGWQMFRHHPLVGAGGGAWAAMYEAYQSEPYTSRLAHNYFLQTVVETGLMGLIGLAGLMAALGYQLLQAVQKRETSQLSLLMAIASLLAHSALDFNFSYYAIAAFFWMILGLLSQDNTGPFTRVTLQRRVPAWGAGLMILPLLLALGMRQAAFAQEMTANAVLEQTQDVPKALSHMNQAVSLNPFHPRYRGNATQLNLYMAQVTGDESYIHQGREDLAKGLRYAPDNEVLMGQQLNLHVLMGETQEVMGVTSQMLHHRRLQPMAYETVAEALNQYGRLLIQRGEFSEALQIFSHNLTTRHWLVEANQTAEKPAGFTSGFRTAMQEAQGFLLVAEAEGYADQTELPQVEAGLLVSLFPSLEYEMGLSRTWRAWGREDAQLVTTLTGEGLVTTNTGTDLGIAYTPNLQLQPATTYQVWVAFDEISLEAPLSVYVIATDSEEAVVQHQHSFTAEETESLWAVFTFTTSDDIDPAKDQYIRFDHPGRHPASDSSHDPGSFTITGLVVHAVE